MPQHTIFARAQRLLNLKDYAVYTPPLDCGKPERLTPPAERQYVLRMMVRRQNDEDFTVPPELAWLDDVVRDCARLQLENGLDPQNDFVYLTVRHGLVTTEEDDLWHVDGFSMRHPHRPEQNYIWADSFPTEILNQAFDFPPDFDPRKHNIHTFFQQHADPSKATTLTPSRLFLIDPYIVHRRPKISAGCLRTFFRVSFIPVEIDDDTCMQNPLFPPKTYDRDGVKDYRRTLLTWRP